MTATSTTGRVLGVSLAAGLLLTTLAPAARADDSRLGLSRDGVHWSDDLTRPLFAPGIRWVPGDVRSVTFYVRNQAEDAGRVDVDLARVQHDALLATSYLTISARAGTGAWTSVDATGTHQLAQDDLDPGAVVPVTVRASLAYDAPNGTMVTSTDLTFDVTMTELDAVLGEHGSRGDGHHHRGGLGGALAATGDAVRRWMPWLGLALTIGGTYLVARRRDREVRHG